MFKLFQNTGESSEYQQLQTELTDSLKLNEIIEQSFREKVYVFKHSTRCGISSIVLEKFRKHMHRDKQPYFYINILKYRSISNEVSDRFNVRHESPQLLVLKNGVLVESGSHYGLLELL